MRSRVSFSVLFACLFGSAFADAAEPIRYTVRFSAPQTHYVEVEAAVPTDGEPSIELMMPVWTPGSYMVRDYARHVEGVTAKTAQGMPLSVQKTRKNRWRVSTDKTPHVLITYRVYCREMGVQTNWVDGSFAMLNGAATFLTRADAPARPHDVALVLPAGWAKSYCGLRDGQGEHRYLADDYDALVDSPIYAGNPTVYTFEVDGKPHYLVNEGEGGIWDGPRSKTDVETIVRTQRAFWGSLPYDKYIFFNMLTEVGGGLEHRNSTLLMASRWATRRRSDYLGWLRLVSHEYFHTWNVKRLRPAELGPFDYEREVVSRSLWIAEGLTSYYGDLSVRRAGLCTVEEYLAGDAAPTGPDADKPKFDVERLQETPGRGLQPLETASFDAWIKFYKRDENTPNTAISYYIKGAVVGLLLDAKIRRATKGAKSLDDVMRRALGRYSGEKGYTPEEFRAVAGEIAGIDLAPWFRSTLETTDELDYTELTAFYGLKFGTGEKEKSKTPEKAWLGMLTKPEDGRLMVAGVKRGTPGFEAGFNVGDEIVAIGDERMLPEQWSRRMEQYRPNDRVEFLITRRGRLIRLAARFGKEPPSTWKIEVDPAASEEQKARRKAWLGEDSRSS